MFKIKTGELKPVEGFRLPKNKNEVVVSYDALAGLGIEYAPDTGKKPAFKPRPDAPRSTITTPTPVAQSPLPSSTPAPVQQPPRAPAITTPPVADAPRAFSQPQQRKDFPVKKFVKRDAPDFRTDKNNLKDIIESAVSEVKKTFTPQRSFNHPPKTLSNPTVSLKSLVQKQTGVTDTPSRGDTKIARPESMNSLKDAIASAIQKTTPPSTTPASPSAPTTPPQSTPVPPTIDPVPTVVAHTSHDEQPINHNPKATDAQSSVPQEEFSKLFE
jgi:hypothetical protein